MKVVYSENCTNCAQAFGRRDDLDTYDPTVKTRENVSLSDILIEFRYTLITTWKTLVQQKKRKKKNISDNKGNLKPWILFPPLLAWRYLAQVLSISYPSSSVGPSFVQSLHHFDLSEGWWESCLLHCECLASDPCFAQSWWMHDPSSVSVLSIHNIGGGDWRPSDTWCHDPLSAWIRGGETGGADHQVL